MYVVILNKKTGELCDVVLEAEFDKDADKNFVIVAHRPTEAEARKVQKGS